MSAKTEINVGGGGFLGLLAVLFIGLKLTGYIDWSWWWVLAPIWGPLAFVVSLIIIGLASYGWWRILDGILNK